MMKEVYTIGDLVPLTGFSRATLTRLFEKQPGIILLERPEKLHNRRYRSMRIPRAIVLRVFPMLTGD